MNKSTQFILYALFFTSVVGMVLFVYRQPLAALLGVGVGGLRIWRFWVNRAESEPFSVVPFGVPKQDRTPTQQQDVEQAYASYAHKHHREGAWKRPGLILAGLLIGYVVILVDRLMIFYTFFMSMMTTWMWFQVWLARKSGS